MLEIILCDDDKFILQLEAQKLQEEILESKIHAQIVCMATTPGDVFRFWKRRIESIFFLDLDLGADTLSGYRYGKENQARPSKI